MINLPQASAKKSCLRHPNSHAGAGREWISCRPYLVTVIIWPNIMQIFLLRGILWREALPSSQQGKKLNLLSIRKIIAWVDPSEELIYVFLSNCLQSSAKINLLSELSVSLKIQDVIYQSIVKSQIIPYFLAWLLPSVKD